MKIMLNEETINNMWYVDFVACLNETNRCPWWKNAIKEMLKNTFLNSWSKVLDVWCNTWYVTFEIARLMKCNVIWLDINENMIKQANTNNTDASIDWLVDFILWDWTKLDFPDNTFDLVTSWWSTIFMNDIEKWLIEYKRVCKDWWFIWDINFFYTDEILKEVISEINELLNIDIKPWKYNYFEELYNKIWLEKYYISTNETYKPDEKKLKKYCYEMIKSSIYSKSWEDIQKIAYNKFYKYMKLFYENNKYLSYGIFIYRKRPDKYKEQITLFWN